MNIPPFHPGPLGEADILALLQQHHNDIQQLLMRVPVIPYQTGLPAGLESTFNMVTRPGFRPRVVKLSDAMYRTAVENATVQQWDGDSWIDSDPAEVIEVRGDFFGGYGFADETYQAVWSGAAQEWCLIGAGHYMIRGTLDAALNDGDDATLNLSGGRTAIVNEVGNTPPLPADATAVATWNTIAGQWDATGPADFMQRGTLAGTLASGGTATLNLAIGGTVTLYEVLGLSASVASGRKVWARWNPVTGHWETVSGGCA